MTIAAVVLVIIVAAVGALLFGDARLKEARERWEAQLPRDFYFDNADGQRKALPASALSSETIQYLMLNRRGSYDA